MFPVSLVNRPDTFDALMVDIATSIERGQPVFLHQHHMEHEHETRTMETTIEAMRQLHAQGRNHIWAYYTRNLVRPVALAQRKVDVIVGNPPWINYNQPVSALRTGLENLSRNTYGIWQGGRYATHQDVAGLFFTRSMDLYLNQYQGGMCISVSGRRQKRLNSLSYHLWSPTGSALTVRS